MQKMSLGCTLDCFDCCKFNVYAEENQVVKIEGDKAHPYTKGMICKKGLAHLERQNHPERMMTPLLKVEGKWQAISFEEAVECMAERIAAYQDEYGLKSILYYEQYGSGSLLKSIGDIFFNFLGGVCKQKGGPCWSAGMAAQKKNFGDARSHALEDMQNSKTIIVWGKNPAYTTIHTMQMIQKARKNGSYVIAIDPIYTKTAQLADEYIPIQPGGDGALALAMGKIILEEGWHDPSYIEAHVHGYEAYKAYVYSLDLEVLCKTAGVSEACVRRLVKRYCQRYSTILLGYGLQKYANGGNTISLIDTLAAITGQIGKSGGGVNYANKVYPGVLDLDPYKSETYGENREFYVSHMSQFIIENNIKMAVITKSNILTQLPNTKMLEKALSQIEFKVCFDQFMTDTAAACDLVIPTTTVLESEDLLFSSMTNPYLIYNEKVLEPKHAWMDEYAFYQALAKRLKMQQYPAVSKKEYLEKVLEPLKEAHPEVNLAYLKDHYFTLHQPIAWKDQKFLTPSGQFEIFFNEDLSFRHREENQTYPFRFLTNHSKDTLFSQHFMDQKGLSKAYIHPEIAEKYGYVDQSIVSLESPQGKIQVVLEISPYVAQGVVMMYIGWWRKHGNPNILTQQSISDIGGQVTYNETFVRINVSSTFK